MDSNQKTVELEIRARDYSTKTLKEVRKSIKDLKEELVEQTKSASKGVADFKKYEASLKGLSDAAEKLSNLQQVVAKLNKLSVESVNAAKHANEAKTNYDKLAESIGKLGVPTERQIKQLARLDRINQNAANKANKAADAYNRQRVEAESYGLSTKNIQRTQEDLAKSYERVLRKIIETRQEQSKLQRQNDLVAKANAAQVAKQKKDIAENNEKLRKNIELWQKQRKAIEAAKAAQAAQKEQKRLDNIAKNNEQLRKNIELWQKQRKAIEAAKQAQVAKDAAKKADADERAARADKIAKMTTAYDLKRNLHQWQAQKKAIKEAKKALEDWLKAQQKAKDAAAAQAAKDAAQAAKDAAAKAKAAKDAALARHQQFMQQQAAIQAARKQAARAQYERKQAAIQATKQAAQQAAAQAAKDAAAKAKAAKDAALARHQQFMQQQAAIQAARKQAARAQYERKKAAQQAAQQAAAAQAQAQAQAALEQAQLNAQRRQINAQRQSLQQQLAQARAEANKRANKASDAVGKGINPFSSSDGAMANITKSVRAAQQAMRNQMATAAELTANIKRLKQAQEQMMATARQIDAYRKQSAEMTRLRTEYATIQAEVRKLNNAMRSGTATQEQIVKLNSLVVKLNQVGAAYARQRVAVSQTADSLRRAGVNINNLAQAENRLAANAARSSAVINQLNGRLSTMGRAANRGADDLRRLANSSRTALSFMQRLKGQVIALTSAYVGLNGAVELFNKVIQAGKDGAVLKIRTEVLADNWADTSAKELEQYFRGTAERMGLELKDVITDASKLFVAAKENGYNVKEAQFVYEQFAGLGQLMGADAEVQKGITKALSDMFSKGTIQAEELKGQLGDRLPQAMALFAKATGKSNAELMKMMEQGKLTSEYIIGAAGTIKNIYGEQIVKMFDTVTANQARMNNAFQDWLRIIAEAGVMENFKALLKEITEWFRSDEGKQWALNIAYATNMVINGLRWAVKHVDELIAAFGVLLALGAAQMLVAVAVGVGFMVKNLSLAAKAVTNFAARISLLSPQVQALFRLMSIKLANGNVFAALAVGARALSVAVAGLFKRFIILEVIIAIVKGIAQGIEEATGSSFSLQDALKSLGDVFFFIGEVAKSVFDVLDVLMVGLTQTVAGAVSFIVGLFSDTSNASTSAANASQNAWSNSFLDSQGNAISFGRKVARTFDSLKWLAKSTALYVSQWFQWAWAKMDGQDFKIREWGEIAQDVAKEISEQGTEARFAAREEMRKRTQQNNPAYKAPETKQPEKRQITKPDTDEEEKKKAKEREKAAKKLQDMTRKVENAREQAERARERAEQAALKRLDKQLSYEKLLEQRVRIWKGIEQEVIKKGQTLREWYLSQYANVRRQYAAQHDPYGDISSESLEVSGRISSGGVGAGATNKYYGAITDNTATSAALQKRQLMMQAAESRHTRKLLGKCATGVKQIVAAAGAGKYQYGVHGKHTARNLISRNIGWQEVQYSANYVPQLGDVMSLSRTGTSKGSIYGHTAMRTRKGWVSDGFQRGMGNTIAFRAQDYADIKAGRIKVTIARYTGKNGGVIDGRIAGTKPVPVKVKNTSEINNKKSTAKPEAVKVTNTKEVAAAAKETDKKVDPKLSTKREEAALKYYQNQKAIYDGMRREEGDYGREEAELDKFDAIVKELSDSSDKLLKDFFKATGVGGIEELMKVDPSKLKLDLSASSLDTIVNGFMSVEQPDIKAEIEKLHQAVILAYAEEKGISVSEAEKMGKAIAPAIEKYAQLRSQQAMSEHVDAFIEALGQERQRWETERDEKTGVISSKVARGAMTAEEGSSEVAKLNGEYVERMKTAITKLDELINSENFKNLTDNQKSGIFAARENLAAQSGDEKQSAGRLAANQTVNAMTEKLKAAVEEQLAYEQMLDAQIANGTLTLSEYQEKLEAYLTKNKQKMLELFEAAKAVKEAFKDKADSESMANLDTQMGKVQESTGRSKMYIDAMRTAQDQLVEGGMTGFSTLADGIGGMIAGQLSYKEALQNTGLALMQWAADALKQIGMVIMKQLVLNAVSSFFGSNMGSMPATVAHSGGVIGNSKGKARWVNPVVFTGATRYHSGGVVGLAPNEVPAILQKGEEVLTRQDPRHRNNGGMMGGSQEPLTVINTFDAVDALRKALDSTAGRKVLVKAVGREQKIFRR